MVNLLRLIFAVFFVVFSSASFADCTVAMSYCHADVASNFPGGSCSASGTTVTLNYNGGPWTTLACASACPSGTTLNSSTGACVTPPPVCPAGSVMNSNTGMCQQIQHGCVTVTLHDGTTSTVCDNIPPLVCPAGQTPGSANGVLMCAGGTPLPAPPKLSAPPAAAAPTATTASPTAVTPYSGPTVTNNTTTNTINTTTTTTTTDSTGGTSTSTSTTSGSSTGSVNVDFGPVVAAVNQTTSAVNQTTDAVNKTTAAIHDNSIFQFCIDNPTLPECTPSSVYDACNSFQCTGDAIQCALLQTQHDIVCQYSAEKNPQLDVGSAMIAGTDNSVPNPAASANRLPVSLPASLDSSSQFAASCPPDVSFSFQGHSVTMPISNWCPSLTILGNIFLALSMLAAAKIISTEI